MNAIIDHDVELRLRHLRTPEQTTEDLRKSIENIKIIADVYASDPQRAADALKTISNIAKEARI